MKRKILLTLLLLHAVFPCAAVAAQWSSELQYGRYYPELDQWRDYYGRDRAPYFGAAMAYRWFSFLELGVEAGRMHDRGRAILASNNTYAGSVELELYPVSAQLQVNARFAAGQWLVPYVAIGATQLYYRQIVVGQEKASGRVTGRLLRTGLAFNMNILDHRAAAYMRSGYGITHTFLQLERRQLTADTDTVALGGEVALMSLRFEF